jgi:tetratricopeptide (TPR) repeat protein
MSNHSTDRGASNEQFLAQALSEQGLVRLGEFVWEWTVRLGNLALPPEVEEAVSFYAAWSLAPANFLPLGQSVREVYIRVEEPRRQRATWHEGRLFWDALTEAIAFLHDERKNRITRVDAQGEYSDPPPPPRVVAIDYMAKFIIEGALEDGGRTPPRKAQEARVRFALALDPLCAEAYQVQGQLEERAGSFHRARISYERAMKIAALLIGPGAVASAETSQAEDIDFWSASDAARAYIRARAALARLLWSKLDDPRGAAALLQGLLALDPGDHLDTHHALLCCLLETGETETLGITLKRLHFDTYEYEGETIIEDWADTWWLYTHACYLYRVASLSGQSERVLLKATLALIRAFHANSYVPQLLLAEGSPVEQGDDAESSPGTPGEAFAYATMALPAWRNTPGALEWLRETLARLEG